MCAPKVDTPAITPPDDATPAASNLALGSIATGTAGLGRLALRLNKTASASPTGTVAKPSGTSSTAAASPTSALALAPAQPVPGGDVAASPYVTDLKMAPNKSLRIPKEV